MRRRQLVDALEHRVRLWHILKSQIVQQAVRMDQPIHAVRRKQALNFRAKHKLAVTHMIIKWLNAEVVSRTEQLLFLTIPDDKTEHPA
ncbi:hypothetical protein D3C85_1303420 [compost metagenome]